jgi:hypothetical protein
MKFQLVLQFEAQETKQFDELVALEETLIALLLPTSEVDGHDFGSGEFNIFVLTDEPEEAFSVAKKLVEKTKFRDHLKAAYRKRGADEFVILWPEHLAVFSVA